MSDLPGFPGTFKALTGNRPFPWQEALYKAFASGDFRSSCDLPTGLGKTSVIHIWLIALANNPAEVPRRLVYIVNRRTVVDQATDEAEKLRRRLNGKGELSADDRAVLERLREKLARLPAVNHDEVLAISTLRGQFADNAEWRADPARPAVIVGTVDMIGSRLLFSGYGLGFKSRPLHAGFLGQHALIVHDEAHLAPAFQELLTAVENEQRRGRTPDFRPLRVMELSATSRGGGEPFELSEEERTHPNVIPDDAPKPLRTIWRRLTAKKGIEFRPVDDRRAIAARVAELAIDGPEGSDVKYKDSEQAILVFLRELKDVEDVEKALRKQKLQVQVLTGTLRGYERDRLAKEDSIFARFLRANDRSPGVTPAEGTVYLVCTSAGEVGVNISADHLVCDLTPFDSMAQRMGRVNRFGDGDARIDVVHPTTFDEVEKQRDGYEARRVKTLTLLRTLPPRPDRRHDASPKALADLLKDERVAAFTPTPVILQATDVLFDAWALTTVKGKLPGRPPVEPYLHGISGWEPPETHVAWREEVGIITGELLERYEPEDLLEDFPLKPHELLRDSTFRKNSGVRDKLTKLAEANGSHPVWIQEPDGSVIATTLSEVPNLRLAGRIVILPPEAGGLSISDKRSAGLFDSSAEYQPELRDLYDVADEWNDDKGQRRRVRVWDDDPHFDEKTKGMRLVRPPIDTKPDPDNDESADDTTNKRYWHWYELPQAADGEGSKTAQKPVLWRVHTGDVARNVEQFIEKLPLSDDIKKALILAARFHDLGKIPARFQRILGNMNPDVVLAKSGKKKRFLSLTEDCRHEFGSLLDVLDSGQPHHAEFAKLSDDMQDVVLHLIAAHHGRARPHFPSDEAFDPERPENLWKKASQEVPQRFARLQRKYGRWGLAYLESLLRAADWAASAKPSETVEEREGQS